jgi:hypothetical protein
MNLLEVLGQADMPQFIRDGRPVPTGAANQNGSSTATLQVIPTGGHSTLAGSGPKVAAADQIAAFEGSYTTPRATSQMDAPVASLPKDIEQTYGDCDA